ncbi:hypothetical protein GCM10023080_022740 [Streptomyces pseudoechinosporeus]
MGGTARRAPAHCPADSAGVSGRLGEVDSVKHWRALIVLGTAQFLMVLDTSVMNVSISQLVEDFNTEVTAIQAVITLYALVMAAFMIIGGIALTSFLVTPHLPTAREDRPRQPDAEAPAGATGSTR